MLMMSALKLLVICFCMLPISAAAIATGIIFGTYNLAIARNPEEHENIFNTSLMAFALVETFVFMAILISIFIFFI